MDIEDLAEIAVLWAEKGLKAKEPAAGALENFCRVLEAGRNGSGVKQCPQPRAAEFFRPKFLEMIEREKDGHLYIFDFRFSIFDCCLTGRVIDQYIARPASAPAVSIATS